MASSGFLKLRAPGSPLTWGTTLTRTAFAEAFGAYHLAGIEAGGFDDPTDAAARREQDALEALIAIQSPHPAGVLAKVEIALQSVRDQSDHFNRLVGELGACEQELAAANVDFGHVGDALAVVSRRLGRAGLHDCYVRLLASAARDARALGGH